VVVGDDIAIGRDDEARSQRLRLARAAATAFGCAEKAAERGSGKRVVGHAHALARRDVDHRGLQLLGQIGKAHRRAGTGGCGEHRALVVLRHLRAQRLARRQNDRAATQQKGRRHCIGISHVQILFIYKKRPSACPRTPENRHTPWQYSVCNPRLNAD